MAQLTRHMKLMGIDEPNYYYTVKARENQIISAGNQILRVISGTAWVSCGRQDYTLKAGESMSLCPQDDKVVVISGLKGQVVRYTLKD